MRISNTGVRAGIAIAALLLASQARADITVGAILSLTGPAASLGIPEKNTIDLLPTKIGNETVKYIVLDDASNPSGAVQAAKKLMDEAKADIIFGPSITPTSLAVVEAAGPGETPMISLAGSAVIAKPVAGNKTWVFKLVPEEPSMAAYVFDHLAATGKRTIAFIGFNDAFGDSFIGAFKKVAEARKVPVVADERYNSKDTSVTAQVLQVIGANPDAIIIGASGTPGVTPVLELRNQGYTGDIYLNQGMANPDVLRVGKDALNGVMMSVAPTLVAEQLPDSNPVKPLAVAYVNAYEAKFGPNSRSLFGATAWDAFLLLQAATPEALKAGAPGTPAFRAALRAAMENTKDLVGAQGVYSMSPTDHNGTDLRSQTLVKIDGQKWIYMPAK